MTDLLTWAASTAELHLGEMGRRWVHVQAVADVARRIAPAFSDAADELVAAAYLHDVGYAPALAVDGFHPLDGGRFLRGIGQERLACLVAHHSGARIEAEFRGLSDYEQEFPYLASSLDDALTFCDLTTSPSGEAIALGERIDEIVTRYGSDSSTSRAMLACAPDFARACLATQTRVEAAGIDLCQRMAGSRDSR